MHPLIIPEAAADAKQGIIAQHEPGKVHHLQGKAVIALGQARQNHEHHAEQKLTVEHIAQLERET